MQYNTGFLILGLVYLNGLILVRLYVILGTLPLNVIPFLRNVNGYIILHDPSVARLIEGSREKKLFTFGL